jgi:hypothetical protein
MNTAVNTDELKQKQVDYLILGLGLTFMLLALLLLSVLFWPTETAVSPAPAPTIEPIHATVDPTQWSVAKNTPPITLQGSKYQWKLTPRAHFQVIGRVLSRQTYNRDWQAEISPLDLALGWGELSDPRSDEWINWRQSGRWYFYTWQEEGPYDGEYLRTHSSNIHIIPATGALEKALLQIREDDKVLLEGRLVDVEATRITGTLASKTSLTRTDTGSGACEILYVERLVWNGQAYP